MNDKKDILEIEYNGQKYYLDLEEMRRRDEWREKREKEVIEHWLKYGPFGGEMK